MKKEIKTKIKATTIANYFIGLTLAIMIMGIINKAASGIVIGLFLLAIFISTSIISYAIEN